MGQFSKSIYISRFPATSNEHTHHHRGHHRKMSSPANDQKSVTRPLRSQSPNRVGSSPLGPPISSAAARLSSVGVDLLSSAARTSSIVTSSNGLATCGGFMRGLSLAGGAAAGTSELIRRTLIVSPHRARDNRATLMTSICCFESSRKSVATGNAPKRSYRYQIKSERRLSRWARKVMRVHGVNITCVLYRYVPCVPCVSRLPPVSFYRYVTQKGRKPSRSSADAGWCMARASSSSTSQSQHHADAFTSTSQ